ncbi:MAG: nuclear transport factor 2 family protein [Deltaproteobacteria bacterium]|nr:nuclear transport factor 2 family protein [Deltaproteobacteria bacterium]
MNRLGALVACSLSLAGCGEKLIPNTDVEDTEDNQKVIDYCEQYRIALEARDVARLLAMTTDDYYEDGGSPSGHDDYDRAGLEQRLRSRFQRVEAVRYDIRYRRVVYFPDRVEVYYSYYGRFQVAGQTAGESLWFSEVGDNRLVLARVPDGYKILSGL